MTRSHRASERTPGTAPATAATGTAPATATGGVGPFVTWARQRRADGRIVFRLSRRHRKGLAPLVLASPAIGHAMAAAALGHAWWHLWGPRRIGWWIAVLFMIGSALFALGGAQGTWPDLPVMRWFDESLANWYFFVGSLFFTSAAYLQFVEAIRNDLGAAAAPPHARPRRRFLGWCPHNLGYVAASVQFAGTLLFNLNTGDALLAGPGWRAQDVLVWTPDMVGSVCFLVASQAALMEISHRYWSWQPGSLSWWIAAINMLGSVFFMVSAVVSFVEPGPVVVNLWLANFGTFAGAVCFFAGAYLLIPELFEVPAPEVGHNAPA